MYMYDIKCMVLGVHVTFICLYAPCLMTFSIYTPTYYDVYLFIHPQWKRSIQTTSILGNVNTAFFKTMHQHPPPPYDLCHVVTQAYHLSLVVTLMTIIKQAAHLCIPQVPKGGRKQICLSPGSPSGSVYECCVSSSGLSLHLGLDCREHYEPQRVCTPPPSPPLPTLTFQPAPQR